MRSVPRSAVLLASLLAACHPTTAVPGVDRPGAARTAAPAATPTGGAATAKPAAGLVPPVHLVAPAGTEPLAGRVEIDGRFAVDVAGAKLIGTDGASLVGTDGASLVGTDGATLVNARGQIVAAGAGNVVVPTTLVGTDGASLIGTDGASIVAAGAGNIVAAGAGNYRLSQAAALGHGASARAAAMWVSVVDTRTGLTTPLGRDDAGKDVYTVYTDARGEFVVHLAPGVAAHARIVARLPNVRDERAVLTVLADAGGDQHVVGQDEAQITGFMRTIVAERLVKAAASRDSAGSSALAAALPKTTAAFDALGFTRLPLEAQRVLALAIADRFVAELRPATLKLTAHADPLDPAATAAIEGKSVTAVLTGVFARMRAASGKAFDAQPDPRAYFAGRPYVVAANLEHPERPVAIERPADLIDLIVREYIASNDLERVALGLAIGAELGLTRADHDAMLAANDAIFGASIALTGQSAVDDTMAALVGSLGGLVARAPAPATPAPIAPPTAPPAGAWVVDTIAGHPRDPGQGITGAARDGDGAAAYLAEPNGLVLDEEASPPRLYVAGTGEQTIRVLSPDAAGAWQVKTLAGAAFETGDADGAAGAGRFGSPVGIALDRARGGLFVADQLLDVIKRVAVDGDGAGAIETFAGQAGQAAFADGPARDARFSTPTAVALLGADQLLIGDPGNNRTRVAGLGTAPAVATWLGDGTQRRFMGERAAAIVRRPAALATGPDGRVYVVERSKKGAIYTVGGTAPNAPVRLLAGGGANLTIRDGLWGAATFGDPAAIAVDAEGRVVVTDAEAHAVRRVTDPGWVSTLAGGPEAGYADGPGATARFSGPRGVAIAKDGTIYVADTGNHCIRRIRPAR